MTALLEVSHLISGYGKLAIIQDMSLTVDEGEVLAIIGANGSGKSTFVRTLFGLTSIFEGNIFFTGKTLTRLKTEEIIKLGISFVPQTNNVFPDLTVGENLELGFLGNRNRSSKESVKAGILNTFPILKERKSQRAATLSGGERQMLALARALMSQPKLLTLDEPTAALAPAVAQQFLSKLEEIHNSGVTIIIVEQNARLALQFAKRGILLVQGKKAFEGSSEEILNNEDIIRLYLGLAGKAIH